MARTGLLGLLGQLGLDEERPARKGQPGQNSMDSQNGTTRKGGPGPKVSEEDIEERTAKT